MCLSVWPVTFEPQELGSSFSACGHILTIFMSRLSIKVIGSKSRSNKEITYFNYSSHMYAYIPLKLTWKVKVTQKLRFRSRSLSVKVK